MKKKIISFTFLILFALLLTYLAGEVDYTAASAIVESEFDDIGLGMAIFMEAFVSIHMSVFVLFPLAGIINKNKVPQTFAVLFGIRLVILIIGDIIAPGIMAIIDFMAVFFGAFVVVPLLGSFKVVTFKGQNTYNEYVEVDSYKLSQIGFTDVELLKRALIQQYIDIKLAYSDFNYKRLIELCTKIRYGLFKNEMKLMEQVGEKREYKDFVVTDAKIYDCYVQKNIVDVSMVLKVEYYSYVLDRFNKVISGSDSKKERQMIEVVFHKKVEEDLIEECPNCGSPISKDNIEHCGYCGTTLNFRVGEWLLSNERIVRD